VGQYSRCFHQSSLYDYTCPNLKWGTAKLKEAEFGWAKEENWRIAREMTKGEIKDTDLGKFLEFVCADKA